MNTSINYIPNGDNDRLLWLNNFNTKLPSYAVAVGILPADVTSVAHDTAMYSYMVNTYKQTVQNLVAYKQQLKHQQNGAGPLGAIPTLPTLGAAPTAVAAGAFDRVSKLVARIKASANYTDSIGKDLGIIATVPVIDVNAMQPNIKVNLDAGCPHIKWTKGNADALDLYVDREDGAGFVPIGRFITPDYIDTTNLAGTLVLAQWHYKGMYVIGNNPVGLHSAAESIIVKKL
jgi:hypothetical protein